MSFNSSISTVCEDVGARYCNQLFLFRHHSTYQQFCDLQGLDSAPLSCHQYVGSYHWTESYKPINTEPSHVCRQCNSHFQSANKLTEHLRTAHSITNKPKVLCREFISDWELIHPKPEGSPPELQRLDDLSMKYLRNIKCCPPSVANILKLKLVPCGVNGYNLDTHRGLPKLDRQFLPVDNIVARLSLSHLRRAIEDKFQADLIPYCHSFCSVIMLYVGTFVFCQIAFQFYYS